MRQIGLSAVLAALIAVTIGVTVTLAGDADTPCHGHDAIAVPGGFDLNCHGPCPNAGDTCQSETFDGAGPQGSDQDQCVCDPTPGQPVSGDETSTLGFEWSLVRWIDFPVPGGSSFSCWTHTCEDPDGCVPVYAPGLAACHCGLS